MEEHGLVFSEAIKSRLHDVPRTGKPRVCTPDDTPTLPPFCLEPLVYEMKVLAAVVNLAGVVACGLSWSQKR
jgi:hypothetical protein